MHKIQILKNNDDYKIPDEVLAEWESLNSSGQLKSSTTDESVIEQYGPLLSTLWDQGMPYNDQVEELECAGLPNGRAWVGCVATAIAQVLKYHQYPSTKYNWGIMPNRLYPYQSGSTGATEVAKLMQYVGQHVKMEYECTGSGAYTKDAISVFKNNFNYKSGGSYAELSDDDAEPLVKADIIAKRPVIMRGSHTYYTTTSGWWLWKKTTHHYKDGHTWVCDGYKKVRKKLTLRIFGKPITLNLSNNYYHMNWGWSGTGQNSIDNNGWFLFSNIEIKDPNVIDQKSGKGRNYQYKRGYLTGIKPR